MQIYVWVTYLQKNTVKHDYYKSENSVGTIKSRVRFATIPLSK